MGGHGGEPQPGGSGRDGGRSDALYEDAVLEKPGREAHRARVVAHDDRDDLGVSGSQLETQGPKLAAQRSGVGEHCGPGGICLAHQREGGDSGAGERGRRCSRVDEAPRTVLDERDGGLARSDERSRGAEGLPQCSDEDVGSNLLSCAEAAPRRA